MTKKKNVIIGSTFKGKIRTQQPTNYLAVVVPPSPKRPEIQQPSKQRTGPRHNHHRSQQNEASFVFIAGNQEVEGNGVELLLLNQVASMSTIAISEHDNTSTVAEEKEEAEGQNRRSSLINAPSASSSSSASAETTGKIGNDTGTDDINNNDDDQHELIATENVPELEIQIPAIISSPPKGGSKTSGKTPPISPSPGVSSPSSPSSPSPKHGSRLRRSIIVHDESFVVDYLQQEQERVEMETAMKEKEGDDEDDEKDEKTPLSLREALHAILGKKHTIDTSTPTSAEELIPDSVAAAVSRTLKSLRGGIGVQDLNIPETDSPIDLNNNVAGAMTGDGEFNQPGGRPKRKRTISFSTTTKESGRGTRNNSTNDPGSPGGRRQGLGSPGASGQGLGSPGGRRQSRGRNNIADLRRSSKDQLLASVAARMHVIAADTASRSRRTSMQMLLAVTATAT